MYVDFFINLNFKDEFIVRYFTLSNNAEKMMIYFSYKRYDVHDHLVIYQLKISVVYGNFVKGLGGEMSQKYSTGVGVFSHTWGE